ncbi:MAG: LptF/LptG family permease [Flavobacteriales bacterium]
MKKLDRYILKQFLGPFLITFFVVIFLLDMLSLFAYIKDFAGKGLDMLSMLELLGYVSLSMVPMAMPLAILLSCITTFGNLGEKYELAALKASGISLACVFRSLIVVVVLLSLGMHFYMENAYPKINFHLLNMKANMVRKNAAVQFRPGVFDNSIPGYYIRVTRKSGPENNILHDVFIQKPGSFYENQETIIAKGGKILNSPSPDYLIMELVDGKLYRDEIEGKAAVESAKQPMSVTAFHKLIQYIDISSITQVDLNKTISSEHHKMLNSRKLRAFSDSFSTLKSSKIAAYTKSALRHAIPVKNPVQIDSLVRENRKPTKSFSGVWVDDPTIGQRLITQAITDAQRDLKTQKQQYKWLKWRTKEISRFDIELQQKWSFSCACLILFFIGAPLGSIIRKGGFGMPFLAATIIFVTYYILYLTGENMATRGRWSAFWGAWLSSIVLFPLGVYLTYKATVDSSLFDIDSYLNPIKRLATRFTKHKK